LISLSSHLVFGIAMAVGFMLAPQAALIT